jgi:hypothetical protein
MSSEDPVSKRINDAVQRLVEEFKGTIPREIVMRSAKEAMGAYQDARISDYIPLLVYRSTREQLGNLAQAQAVVEKGPLGGR